MKLFSIAIRDIFASVIRLELIYLLGLQDIKQRYRRSSLGPFWLTMSMGVMICTMGIVFGLIFNAPIKEFLPYLTLGIVLWSFMSLVMIESSTVFMSYESIIKQLPIPLFVHIARMLWRNIIVFSHNLIIFPIVLLAVGKPLTWAAFLCLPGFALLVINLAWIALFLGIICTRYRDLPQLITSVLQIVFYLTPIMWLPSALPSKAGKYVLMLNPFYHLIEIVRSPLLGQAPEITSWEVAIGLAILGWAPTLAFYGKYRNRITYWL